jgi:hypothetical protein
MEVLTLNDTDTIRLALNHLQNDPMIGFVSKLDEGPYNMLCYCRKADQILKL